MGCFMFLIVCHPVFKCDKLRGERIIRYRNYFKLNKVHFVKKNQGELILSIFKGSGGFLWILVLINRD